jgi:NAD(P)H-dependent flavin oxidoreductase YrpB (nitropropane dioxygenase family)
MLTTPLCDLFGIEVPIILAPMGTCTSAVASAYPKRTTTDIGHNSAACQREAHFVRRPVSISM